MCGGNYDDNDDIDGGGGEGDDDGDDNIFTLAAGQTVLLRLRVCRPFCWGMSKDSPV